MTKEEIVDEVTSLLPYVVKYQEQNNYFDFDYGYLYQLDVWECTFFDKHDNITERFVGSSQSEIIKQLS